MSKPILYSFFRSSTAWRARIAVNLKQFPVEYSFVNLLKNQQSSQAYRKVNPNTGVPSLVLTDGTILIESMAIIEYLNEIKKQPHDLFPGKPHERALIRGFCEVINSGIHPYQNLKLIKQLNKDHGVDMGSWSRQWTSKGVQTIQALITKIGKSGKYVFGDSITAADIFFYPQVYATKNRWGVDLSPYPNIQRILANLQNIKEFVDAAPDNQPDRE